MKDDVHFQNGQILVGDVLERLKDIPDESVDCIISSPPYWSLRDYGVEGQLGLEPDFRDYLKIMRKIMDELKRVLKKTGTCWINLGDSYAGGIMHSDWQGVDERFDCKRMQEGKFKGPFKNQIQAKSRCGIPERFYIQCIDDGWIARNHIPWYKANSMPSSIKDRFTNKWESVFFFAKERKYYFNLDAVRVPTLTDSKPFNIRVRDNISGLAQQKLGDQAWTATEEEMEKYNKDGTLKKQNNTVMGNGRIDPTKKNFNKRYKESKYIKSMSQQYARAPDRIKEKRLEGIDHEVGLGNVGQGKNPGDVFFINPRPFPDAHFATFPPELPEKILKCACPEFVCKKCGVPRNPIMKPTEEYAKLLGKSWHSHDDDKGKGMTQDRSQKADATASYVKVGYTDCGCNAGFEGGIVLDPFFGSGTVGLVAEQLNKKWIGIEINKEYVEMATKRLMPYNTMRISDFL